MHTIKEKFKLLNYFWILINDLYYQKKVSVNVYSLFGSFDFLLFITDFNWLLNSYIILID